MAITRCKSTYTTRSGAELQCEHIQGHDSVHYNGDVWWPNKRGLPFHQRAHSVWQSITRWLHNHL
jgi:hypothetical protein